MIDFRQASANNRFLAVRELKITGLRAPHYNRRADLVCFVNGLPLVFIELKAVYKNIRAGFDDNLSDYLDENIIAHAFHHNAFLVVSNGDHARYGSITSKWEHFVEWKRNDETGQGQRGCRGAARTACWPRTGCSTSSRTSSCSTTASRARSRKIVARNHQVLGVNNAVASVVRQEELKREFPPDERLAVPRYRTALLDEARESRMRSMSGGSAADAAVPIPKNRTCNIVERAHPDLGRLGVFWHTQGSGKSYSMAFFAEKVRRMVPGNFTFLLMTDREDLDDQIYRTFVGCGVADEKTPRAGSGQGPAGVAEAESPLRLQPDPQVQSGCEPEQALQRARRHHRHLGRGAPHPGRQARAQHAPGAAERLVHRLHRHAALQARRADQAHLRRLRLALRLQALGGRRRHGQAGLREPGREAGHRPLDLNDRIAEAIEKAELDPDQEALLEKLLGKDYEVITADDRLDKIAADFVEHCSTRWESGKSMLVCIDKITCARMFQRIVPRWQAKAAAVRARCRGQTSRQLQPATDADLDSG